MNAGIVGDVSAINSFAPELCRLVYSILASETHPETYLDFLQMYTAKVLGRTLLIGPAKTTSKTVTSQ